MATKKMIHHVHGVGTAGSLSEQKDFRWHWEWARLLKWLWLAFVATITTITADLVLAQDLEIVTIDGTYQGQVLYIQNPYDVRTRNFCVVEVQVNGQALPSNLYKSSAFEIDFAQLGLKKGQYVEIVIKHRKGCRPRVLNPGALVAKSTFELVSFTADENSIRFTTRNEISEEPFYIEREEYGKWKVIAKVKGKGPGGFNTYVVRVDHFSGENRYRIKQRDAAMGWRYGDIILVYRSRKPPVTFYPQRVSTKIRLSRPAEYMIYDSYGNKVKEGRGQEIDVRDLKPGVYYLFVDNKKYKFLKK